VRVLIILLLTSSHTAGDDSRLHPPIPSELLKPVGNLPRESSWPRGVHDFVLQPLCIEPLDFRDCGSHARAQGPCHSSLGRDLHGSKTAFSSDGTQGSLSVVLKVDAVTASEPRIWADKSYFYVLFFRHTHHFFTTIAETSLRFNLLPHRHLHLPTEFVDIVQGVNETGPPRLHPEQNRQGAGDDHHYNPHLPICICVHSTPPSRTQTAYTIVLFNFASFFADYSIISRLAFCRVLLCNVTCGCLLKTIREGVQFAEGTQ